MSIIGVDMIEASPPVIECAQRTYCIDGGNGPSNIALDNLVLQDATKADVQIGGGDAGTVTDWTLNAITAQGAGEVGIAVNQAASITVSDSLIDRNGSTPYDASLNPTGDFGLRAVGVDYLTMQSTIVSDNPVTTDANVYPSSGFTGGAKFNTDTNLLVQGNTFAGNEGGAQLWVDIDSHDFRVSDNTIAEQPNAVTGLLAQERIRVEVSCGGVIGGFNDGNRLTVPAGTATPDDVAGIDLYDSNGITVENNMVTVPHQSKPNFGIRIFGSHHNAQPPPADYCADPSGNYLDQNNVAIGNTIDMTATGNALDGMKDIQNAVSSGNLWSDNIYTMRHCDGAVGPGKPPSDQWIFSDGAIQNQYVNYQGWQAFGQDAGGTSTCTSTYPEITSFSPQQGPAGSVVTIVGSGLLDASSATLKGTPMSGLHVDSDTQITATVPDGAISGPICVQNPVAASARWCTTESFSVVPPATVTSLTPSSGLPGGEVSIGGTNLTGASSVTFAGSAAAGFTGVSDTEIDATVPATAVTGPVCVQMPGQGDVCSPGPFTVLPPAAPVLTSPNGRFHLAPFAASWTSSQGAASYDVDTVSAPFNGGFSLPTETPEPSTSAPMPFVLGDTTCIWADAVDGGGSSAPSARTCTAVPLDDRSLTVSRGNWTQSSAPRFYDETAITSTLLGSTLKLGGVQARRIYLLIEARPGGGTVDVLLNGVLLRTVSTDAGTLQDHKLVQVGSWSAIHTGTIKLRVTTAGKPVVIDGIGLSRL